MTTHSGVLHIHLATRWMRGRYACTHNVLADLANVLGISRWHISRLVRLHTGMGFREHLRIIEMDRTAALVVNTSLSVKEISWKVGYCHASNFV